MTEIPSADPLFTEQSNTRITVPDERTELTEDDLLGESVFFVTQVGAWPAVVVGYDPITKRAAMQVFNKKTDGCILTQKPVRHISTGDTPCWAWKHETPFGGLQSVNREDAPPKRAHTRKSSGGIAYGR
jgi:hypothetical protein